VKSEREEGKQRSDVEGDGRRRGRSRMEEEVLKSYKTAESISNSCIPFAKSLVKEGAKALDIAERIEEKIRQLGGKPAWPVNISINENAAHYTPDVDDATVLKEGDFVKIDIGVHVDGYIWDKAFTICIGAKTHPLIEASELALEAALKLIKPGTRISEISEVVESVVTEAGFNPVRNLCGHGLERYNQHAWPSIPNGRNNIKDEIPADSVIAMEVFTTTGTGWVKESDLALIYQYVEEKPVRMWEARQILQKARQEFNGLPFAKRWLNITPVKAEFALKQLLDAGAIKAHRILKEQTDKPVAQTEETIIVK